jgi:hypothetical protein
MNIGLCLEGTLNEIVSMDTTGAGWIYNDGLF